jgi:hypothetical protein
MGADGSVWIEGKEVIVAEELQPLTEPQARALTILEKADEPMTSKWFAKQMWPDSKGWKTPSSVRGGTVRGKAMPGLGGRMLRRLQDLKLVWGQYSEYWQASYSISARGRKALKKWREAHYGS